jgi:hypothetical protein
MAMPTSGAWLPWKTGAQAGSPLPKGLLRLSATAPPSLQPEAEACQRSPLATMVAVERSQVHISLRGGRAAAGGGGWVGQRRQVGHALLAANGCLKG